MTIFTLPDLGEGLPDAEIVTWHVEIGQEIEIDQPVVSMETAKALVEVPSPYKGRVIKLFGMPGELINTGSALIEIETEDTGTVAGKLEESKIVIQEIATQFSLEKSVSTNVKATPAVRALAKRLKVNLNTLHPANPNGIITTGEVEMAAKNLAALSPSQNLTGVRRRMVDVMQQANAQCVPVTLMEDAKLFRFPKKADITVELMVAMIKACHQEPALNVWYDPNTQSRRVMTSIHIGIAMDTAEGLFVPVIQEAEKLNPKELRIRLEELKVAVQERKILPEHLQGGTITLSNFGKFAGRYATPIIIPPMVAILAAGRVRQEVVVVDEKPEVCEVLPLSLTFDHRVVTGGEAARFLGVVVEYLEKK